MLLFYFTDKRLACANRVLAELRVDLTMLLNSFLHIKTLSMLEHDPILLLTSLDSLHAGGV